jgi:hypothetical protein
MSIGRLIYSRLSGDSYITDRVGDKIFPSQIPQNTEFPAIVYNQAAVSPTNVKTGPSPVDVADVRIILYFAQYQTARETADRARELLDGLQGVYAGVDVDRVVFADEDTSDFVEGYGFFVIEQAYSARIKRA